MRSETPPARTGPGPAGETSRAARPAGRCRPETAVWAMAAALATVTLAAILMRLADGVSPGGADPVRLLVLVVLFAAAEKFVVTFPVRRGSHTISLSEIPLVLGLVMVDPAVLVLVRIGGALVGLTLFRRQRGSKLAFNMALFGVQTTVASAVFHAVAGSADLLDPIGWIAAYAATFFADVVSIVLVTAAIAVHDDSQEWRRLLQADIKSLLQLPMVTITTTLALVTALVVRERPHASVLLAVLSFAAYQVFRRYAQQSHGHAQVEQLYAFTRSLNGAQNTDDVTRTVLSQVRDLVRAGTAELVVLDPGRAPLGIRMFGQEQLTTVGYRDVRREWWAAAAAGSPVHVPARSLQRPDGLAPVDGMGVPVALDDAMGVLLVSDTMPDTPVFTTEHLRLLQALAAHAGVALTNVRLVDRLRHSGLHDPLTGLPNRRRFHEDVQQAVQELLDETGPVAVLLMDLDRFKEVNEALGHDIGDDLLREIGRRLVDVLGARGTVARLGGDEFAVLIPAPRSREDVLAVAWELRRTVERPVQVGNLVLTTQVSIGVCYAPDHGLDADRLLRRADVAMYAAKDARAGVRTYRPEDDRNTPRRLRLMADLRTAVTDGGLTVAYQPKVDPRTGVVLGAEALSRWHHPDGLVPPDEFIPLAERGGLIRALTRNVLDDALTQCARWRRAGHEMSVAVNLSPHMLADPTVADDVQTVLQRHGLPAAALTLEITENGVMDDPAHTLLTLRSLHTLGVALSIDDFGTGHSSLGRLAELPIQELKIDKSFVRDLTHHRTRRAVTDASLQLGRALDLLVVAEGVENAVEYEYLRREQCGAIQGFHVARPMPAADFLRWLSNRPAEPAAASRAPSR